MLEGMFASRRREGAGRRQIAFYGGSFTGLPRRLQEAYLEACVPFLERGLVDSIRVSTRPDAVSGEILEGLARRGVGTVEIGIQSLSEEVLRRSRRGYGAETARRAIRVVQEAGLEVGAQILVGLPGDDGSQSLETAEQLCRLRPDFVRIYPLWVFRETELAAMTLRGEYRPLGLEEAVSLCAGLLERFESASVPVARIGLQDQAGMTGPGGAVLAGPYHPAFGHLVRSRRFRDRVREVLPRTVPRSATVRIRIHPHDRPLLAGNRGENLRTLGREIGGAGIRVEEDAALPRGSVRCFWD